MNSKNNSKMSKSPTTAEINIRKIRRRAKENDRKLTVFVNFLINHRGGVKNLPLIFVAPNYNFLFLLDNDVLIAFNNQLLQIAECKADIHQLLEISNQKYLSA